MFWYLLMWTKKQGRYGFLEDFFFFQFIYKHNDPLLGDVSVMKKSTLWQNLTWTGLCGYFFMILHEHLSQIRQENEEDSTLTLIQLGCMSIVI